jgi:hypothetical protein
MHVVDLVKTLGVHRFALDTDARRIIETTSRGVGRARCVEQFLDSPAQPRGGTKADMEPVRAERGVRKSDFQTA